VIVGSGPSGVFAAKELRDKKVLILDVGHSPDHYLDRNSDNSAERTDLIPSGNLYELRKSDQDLFDILIGKNFENLGNIFNEIPVSLKLKAPLMTYILKDWQKLFPITCCGFDAVQSFAKGGLANAWGAGAYRFDEFDLKDFPIHVSDLSRYYDEITDEIGISGAADDLSFSFGSDYGLQPPLEMAGIAKDLFSRYQRKKEIFEKAGIKIGKPRLAVASRKMEARSAYAYENLEFFKPHMSSIYNPVFTLEKLLRTHSNIAYRSGALVTRYLESSESVRVEFMDLDRNTVDSAVGRTLFLAAGALGSSKIVLASTKKPGIRLPLLDNPMACVPFFCPRRLGLPIDPYDSSLGQLNLVHETQNRERVQATFYGTNGPLRSDIIFETPLPFGPARILTKYLASAMGLMMIFYPARKSKSNYIALRPDGKLEMNHRDERLGDAEATLVKIFKKIGFYSHMSLCQYPKMGSSLHFAGLLPMKDEPKEFETNKTGQLFGHQHVYIGDGAAFSDLPAKNLTMTLMANSMRIASHIKKNDL